MCKKSSEPQAEMFTQSHVLELGTMSEYDRSAPRPRGNDSPITRMRLAKGLTQAQLAEIVGCRQVDISLWENGVRQPSAKSAIKLAHALNCRMEELYGLEG